MPRMRRGRASSTMSQRESDLALLRSILSPGNAPELSEYEKMAFAGMLHA